MVSWNMETMCRVVKDHRVIVMLVYHGKTVNWCRIFAWSWRRRSEKRDQAFAEYWVSMWTEDVGGCLLISLW